MTKRIGGDVELLFREEVLSASSYLYRRAAATNANTSKRSYNYSSYFVCISPEIQVKLNELSCANTEREFTTYLSCRFSQGGGGPGQDFAFN